MNIIKPEYYTLDDLLLKNFFEIPDYQRTYSWTRKQRLDLFNDIKKIHKWRDKNRHHFMATIVCLREPTKSKQVGTIKYEKFNIVDGQQRITTLILLLKAISLNLDKDNNDQIIEAEIIDNLLVKKDKRLILLQTNHDNYNIFRNYLENGTKPGKRHIRTFSDKNLVDAFKECESFVKEWQNDNQLLILLSYLKNRLGFIFYTIDEPGAVYTIFEVLNSRGLAVDWLDKAKSVLMGFVHEKFSKTASQSHIKELHNNWINIYRDIGLANISGEEIVKFSATLLNENIGNKPMSAEESIDFFIEYCETDKQRVFEIVDFLQKVTMRLKAIYTNRRQKAVTEISQARLAACAIKLSSFAREDKDILLDQWERITFRIFGIHRKDSRTAVGDYVRFSKFVMSKERDFDTAFDKLLEIGSWYPVTQFSELLGETNCYDGWEEELRYFLFRYEEYLAGKDKTKISYEIWESIWRESPIKSIEHIYPQDPYEHWSDWKGKLGRAKNAVENNKHRLGNLILLSPGINSSCSNLGFYEKKKIYKKELLRLKDEIVRKRDWDIRTISFRERKLIRWAKETWCDRY